MMALEKNVPIIKNPKKIKKKKTNRRSKRSWRRIPEALIKTLKSKMSISEVMDLFVMSQIVDKGCRKRVSEHFKNMEFNYLNSIEIAINGEKMNVFDITSFLEWLGSFDIPIHSAEFINFPSDGNLNKALFETVEKVSKGTVLWKATGDIVEIHYNGLESLYEKTCSMEDPRDALQKMYPFASGMTSLQLNLCSTDNVYQLRKSFLADLLAVINPTHFTCFCGGSMVDSAPVDNDCFSVYRDSIVKFKNEKLQTCSFLLGGSEDTYLPSPSQEIEGVQISVSNSTAHFFRT